MNFTHWLLGHTSRFSALGLFFVTVLPRAADFQVSNLTVENGTLSLTYTRSQPGTYRLLQGTTVGDVRTSVATNFTTAELGKFSVKVPDGPGASFYEVELFVDATDTDQDGIPDSVETALGLDPLKPSTRDDGVLDGDRDLAHDGLTVRWKLKYGYDPLKLDSNGNGISDAKEDPDLDGLTNLQEKVAGTNPFSADTDGDGWDDKSEIKDGTNPLDATSGPRFHGFVETVVSFFNGSSSATSPPGFSSKPISERLAANSPPSQFAQNFGSSGKFDPLDIIASV